MKRTWTAGTWRGAIGGLAVGLALLAAGVAHADVGGWDYLVDKLVADGVPRERAVRTFSDPRMPAFDGLPFGLDPREPTSRYRNFRTAAAAQAARRCYDQHLEVLRAAEVTHGVPGTVVAAIMYVETGCGRNVGTSRILHRLARLAMANEPANLRWNIERHGAGDPVTVERVRARGRYLEDTFYPEVLATFAVADRLQYDPLEIRGSGSGAFGNPQFLPTSYLKHGRDGDGDGHVDLFSTADAASSCARYLASFGWTPTSTDAEKRRVIWHYNRSDAYVDTVLLLAQRIDDPDAQMAAQQPAPKRRAAAAKKAPTATTKRSAQKTGAAKAASAPASAKSAGKTASAKPASAKPAPARTAPAKAAPAKSNTAKSAARTAPNAGARAGGASARSAKKAPAAPSKTASATP
ncbi:MAG: lytic murein transglycosylase [bacterium]|nr:lytic murein transglycosylase [bacterium]